MYKDKEIQYSGIPYAHAEESKRMLKMGQKNASTKMKSQSSNFIKC